MRKTGFVLLAVAVLLALPFVLSESYLNAAIQMLIAALFATAFSLLCGQGGMLSFGHAAYFGLGAFASVHAMNAFNGEGVLPTPLIPLAGAAAGLVAGAVAGWFSAKRTGVYFAMITLALAELVHALAPHLKETFGGEAGVSSFRMPAWGFDFGSSVEVYYLTLGWTLLSLLCLYLLTRTPFGRVTLGIRENAHRLRFLGYDVHRLSVFVFAISAMFSGVAGALQSINIEAANYVVFEAHVSSAVVLNSFIGGVQVFLGPAIGGAAMAFFGYVTSDLTRSWLLYQGAIFVLVMMFLPRGIVGELLAAVEAVRESRLRVRWWRVLVGAVALMASVAGAVIAIELVQRVFDQGYPGAAGGWPPVRFAGRDWAPTAPLTWAAPILLLAGGIALLRWILGRSAKSGDAT